MTAAIWGGYDVTFLTSLFPAYSNSRIPPIIQENYAFSKNGVRYVGKYAAYVDSTVRTSIRHIRGSEPLRNRIERI